jgi:putative addiction module killer protein
MRARLTAVYWDWIELKMDFGPGYRVYYTEWKGELVVLCGGDKSSQRRDIHTALTLARHL